jgi:oxepin-CoA hydrolase/3-oxo-5,6-dehydrosuberyl-CoA semialdehyde dehydrogenase
MTVKAGQKCTAIRRAIVPRRHLDAVADEAARAAGQGGGRRPGAAGRAHGRAGLARAGGRRGRARGQLRAVAELVTDAGGFAPLGDGVAEGAFFAPTLLLCDRPFDSDAVHDIEAFGPVSTLMPYDDDAAASTRRWRWPRAAVAAWSARW